jgi:hypothetical protein
MEHPPFPGLGHRDSSSAAGEFVASGGAPESAAEEAFPHQLWVKPHVVLNAWRAVEREFNEVTVGSPSWQRLSAYLDCLRGTYHAMFEEFRHR